MLIIPLSPGIEPTGNCVGAPARFIVETFGAGRGEVEVIVLNPRGQQEPVSSTQDKGVGCILTCGETLLSIL